MRNEGEEEEEEEMRDECTVGPQSYQMEGSLVFRDGWTRAVVEVEMTKNQLTVRSPGVANIFLRFFSGVLKLNEVFFITLVLWDQNSVSVTYKNIKIWIRFSRQIDQNLAFNSP